MSVANCFGQYNAGTSPSSGGGGDVTLAGNNDFTGENSFSQAINTAGIIDTVSIGTTGAISGATATFSSNSDPTQGNGSINCQNFGSEGGATPCNFSGMNLVIGLGQGPNVVPGGATFNAGCGIAMNDPANASSFITMNDGGSLSIGDPTTATGYSLVETGSVTTNQYIYQVLPASAGIPAPILFLSPTVDRTYQWVNEIGASVTLNNSLPRGAELVMVNVTQQITITLPPILILGVANTGDGYMFTFSGNLDNPVVIATTDSTPIVFVSSGAFGTGSTISVGVVSGRCYFAQSINANGSWMVVLDLGLYT